MLCCMRYHSAGTKVYQGNRITEATAANIERTLIRSFKKTPDKSWDETLVCSIADIAPIRMGPGVQKVCMMTSDLRGCQIHEFEKQYRTVPGFCGLKKKSHFEAKYSVKVLVGMADVKFELWFAGRPRSELLKISWESLGDRIGG
jgi:hypothetical protein